MKNRLDKYVLDKAEELVFITIDKSEDLGLIGYEVPKEGIKIPIKSNVLVKSIKDNKAQEEINMMSMIDAMIYLEGIDPDFIYNVEYDDLIETFARKSNLDYMDYMGYMSNQAYSKGEIRDALVYIRAYLRMEPDDIMGLYQYAIICQELSLRYQKDEDVKAMNDFLLEALASLEKIIGLDDSFALAYYQLGFHYSNQSQFVKAKLTWDRALDLGLDDETRTDIMENLAKIDHKVRYEYAYNLVFQGKAEEGLQDLLDLESQYPDWWNLLFIISLAYKSLGDLGQAKSYLEKILITRPTQVDTLVEMALCLAQEANMTGAIDYLTRAAKLKKDDPEILCNLGMAYLHNGEEDEARYYIGRAYEIDPTDEVTQACIRTLDAQ
ncbi:MAG: tetratricopeptide repeat protein [Peptostreptococcus stomatis]|uniref:tetratricopeptide repeat protein n=1 Tax=Peptostreptococcus stomatis TaxID=341694 RepID=UPI001A647763|nr:tetratricopeptide repeat protein [Peptostreptococcus stomatis]MBL6465437.1 tetratricopeptide repeat protein [Peptostreptococcus stomatis]